MYIFVVDTVKGSKDSNTIFAYLISPKIFGAKQDEQGKRVKKCITKNLIVQSLSDTGISQICRPS